MSGEQIILDTLNRIESKVDTHTDILANLKANEHKPDECPTAKRLSRGFKEHLKKHETQRLEAIAEKRSSSIKTAAKECARLVASAIAALAAALSVK